jgi:hypothetical protein
VVVELVVDDRVLDLAVICAAPAEAAAPRKLAAADNPAAMDAGGGGGGRPGSAGGGNGRDGRAIWHAANDARTDITSLFLTLLLSIFIFREQERFSAFMVQN